VRALRPLWLPRLFGPRPTTPSRLNVPGYSPPNSTHHTPPKHTRARSHVILPKELAKAHLKAAKLLSEVEWRSIGVQQSRGWEHYAIHRPEPHILLFRRPLGCDPVSGKVRANEREGRFG
jgi:cyclin-dependent kinase regulatory subunit CKS1